MRSMTQLLLLVTIGASLLGFASGGQAFTAFALWPLGSGFAPWQLVTYALLHGGLLHLAFNMYGLWMFGSPLEQVWGARGCCSTTSSACWWRAGATDGRLGLADGLPTVGASGGLFGLLLGYAMLFPQRRLMLLFPPIPMPAWLFAVVFGVLS